MQFAIVSVFYSPSGEKLIRNNSARPSDGEDTISLTAAPVNIRRQNLALLILVKKSQTIMISGRSY
jgi:hypothetical protein